MRWREILGRVGRVRPRSDPSLVRLRAAAEVIGGFEQDGATEAAARAWTLRQIEGLRREVDDDASWSRLCELVRRAADPWNADDWPLGFDALLCCVPLCTLVSFECARCRVGMQQDGMSCAHPQSAFGAIWERIRERDRDGLREHLTTLERMIASWP